MNDSTALASDVVSSLLGLGVEHVVLCPGSRNAPLSFELYDAARAGRLTLHTRIDERTGGFLALGIAKSSRRPAAVVTTSGTAAANLHPAVLEAAHAGVPLVAVTADRPERMRGTGANQTTDQVGLFGDAVVADADVRRAGDLSGVRATSGPVHLNVQFDEPLVAIRTQSTTHAATTQDSTGPEAVFNQVAVSVGPRTVVVAGDDSGNRARLLAEEAGWPLLAEPSSGSRNGETPIRTYRLLLGTALAERIERVVVLGHPTLSRPVSRLLARTDVEVVSVRANGRWPDRPFPVTAEHRAVRAAGADDPGWLDEWRTADDALSARIDAFLAGQDELTPWHVAAEVNAAVPANGLLFVGASNPVRDLDLMARPYRVGERRLVIANRGLAGIDGTVSSAIGAVLGRPHTSRAIAYVGDVTFLHDLTGLAIGPDEQRPDLTIVVANDDGGSIFATLEQGDPAFAASYDKLFGTPHGLDLGAVCAGLGVTHRVAGSPAELAAALAVVPSGIEVIEARVRRDNRRDLDERIRALATIAQPRSSRAAEPR